MLEKFKKIKKEHKETIDEAKDVTKELMTTYTSNVPGHLHENRNKIFDIIVQYHKGEISSEAIKPTLKAANILLRLFNKRATRRNITNLFRGRSRYKKGFRFYERRVRNLQRNNKLHTRQPTKGN